MKLARKLARKLAPKFAPKLALNSVLLLLVIVAGCRTIEPVNEIRSAAAPDITRVTLTSGTIVTFDRDLGWYNHAKAIVEGVTIDSQRVSYPIAEISKVEVVGNYSIGFAIGAAIVLLGAGLFILSRVLAFL